MSKVANIEYYYKAVGAGGFKLNVVGPKVTSAFSIKFSIQFNNDKCWNIYIWMINVSFVVWFSKLNLVFKAELDRDSIQHFKFNSTNNDKCELCEFARLSWTRWGQSSRLVAPSSGSWTMEPSGNRQVCSTRVFISSRYLKRVTWDALRKISSNLYSQTLITVLFWSVSFPPRMYNCTMRSTPASQKVLN